MSAAFDIDPEDKGLHPVIEAEQFAVSEFFRNVALELQREQAAREEAYRKAMEPLPAEEDE